LGCGPQTLPNASALTRASWGEVVRARGVRIVTRGTKTIQFLNGGLADAADSAEGDCCRVPCARGRRAAGLLAAPLTRLSGCGAGCGLDDHRYWGPSGRGGRPRQRGSGRIWPAQGTKPAMAVATADEGPRFADPWDEAHLWPERRCWPDPALIGEHHSVAPCRACRWRPQKAMKALCDGPQPSSSKFKIRHCGSAEWGRAANRPTKGGSWTSLPPRSPWALPLCRRCRPMVGGRQGGRTRPGVVAADSMEGGSISPKALSGTGTRCGVRQDKTEGKIPAPEFVAMSRFTGYAGGTNLLGRGFLVETAKAVSPVS